MVAKVDTAEVQALRDRGAQLVEVLPAPEFAHEHIPGAINIPLDDIATAPQRLDATRAVVVYCYDYQCDLSARGAARLELMGFDAVYDYAASKVAWFAEGLPSEGVVDDAKRAISRLGCGAPTVCAGTTLGDVADVIDGSELAVVCNERGVVVGVVRREATDGLPPGTAVDEVMQPAAPTVRPSMEVRELAESMDKEGQSHVLVTTLGGRFLGIVRRVDLDRDEV